MLKASFSLLTALLLSSALQCQASTANNTAASTQFEQGLKLYKLGQYRKAAASFCEASQQEPTSQLYHYYLANCFVHMDEHRRAAAEYKQAYLIDSSNSTAEFCRKALVAYKKKMPDDKSLDLDLTDYSELGRVKKRIRKQANFEADKHNIALTRNEQAAQAQLDEQLRAIDLQMQADIQKLHDPIIYSPGPQVNRLLALPELLKEREEQIRVAAQLEKQRIIKEANERSKIYEGLRKDRSALLDETADNLESQLDQPVGRSGVKLQTQGTGLYVRYYGKSGRNYCPDPHQATVRLQDANAAKESESATEEVKGKIVKDPYFVNTLAGK